MNELVKGVLTLIDALGPLAWLIVIGSFIFGIIFLGIFVWFVKKIFSEFNKPFFPKEYEAENKRLKEQLKEIKKKRG